jgi:hypothetical protein
MFGKVCGIFINSPCFVCAGKFPVVNLADVRMTNTTPSSNSKGNQESQAIGFTVYNPPVFIEVLINRQPIGED